MTAITYTPSPTVLAMMRSNAQVRCMIGPVGCLPAETEFLSEHGWMRMDKWRPGMKVVQWQLGNNLLRSVDPVKYIAEPCSEMLEFSAGGEVLMVATHNHRVPCYSAAGEFEVLSASELAGRLAEGAHYSLKMNSPLRHLSSSTAVRSVTPTDGMQYCFEVPSSFFIARHNGRVFVTGNSGKSVGCLMEMVRRAKMQEPGQDGLRRTRYIVVRNTVQQLKDTTIATFFDWFPPGAAGTWREQEKKFIMRTGDTHIEWLFRSLDRPEDTSKLLSLEFSGAYMNEARELPFEIYVGIKSRLGRYPPPKDGTPCTFPFIIMDTNPPDVDSWIYRLGEKEKTIEIYTQPPAMLQVPGGGYEINPQAENLANLPKGYYESMVQDADQEFIDVHVLAKYGASKAGTPVWPEYRPEMHLVPASIRPDPSKLIVVGMDFALNPAAVFKQADTWGHVSAIAEAVGYDMGLQRFIKTKFIPVVREKFVGKGYRFVVIGDPSGDFRTEITEETPFDYLEELGFEVIPAPTNKLDPRIGATKDLMTTLAGDMRPRWQVSQDCESLVKAVSHGYRYARKKDGEPAAKPDKNMHSHVADANQYADMFYVYGLDASGRYMHNEDDWEPAESGHIVADTTMGY